MSTVAGIMRSDKGTLGFLCYCVSRQNGFNNKRKVHAALIVFMRVCACVCMCARTQKKESGEKLTYCDTETRFAAFSVAGHFGGNCQFRKSANREMFFLTD